MLDRYFRLTENHTTVRTECLAGATTFLTMAYIIFVNPAVLSVDFAGNSTGLDHGAVLFATCVSAAIATVIMGLYARYPIAQAPGMGNNYFFVSVVMGLTSMGVPEAWRVALGIVFISGAGFLLLSFLRVRQAIITSLSPSLRAGISVGIGLFIAFIGLRNGGLVVSKPGTLIGLNAQLFTPGPMIFMVGLLLVGALQARRVPGALLIGIFAAGVAAWLMGLVETPTRLIGWPHIEHSALFQMDIKGAFTLACAPFVIMFLFMDVFDTVGTLVGVSERVGFMKNNELPRANRALISDAVGTMVGASLGTSTVTSFMESAAGVAVGGRTGLVNIVVAALFLSALIFSPLVALLASYPPITAPALVFVGVFMTENIRKVDWDDVTESLPAFLVMIGIPLTSSIADGLALGFLSYPLVKLLAGRARDVRWFMAAMAALMLAYFIFVRARIG